VHNLTNSPAITVHNASGITNGVPYVETLTRVMPSTYVDVKIEYYSPMTVMPNPILHPELVPLANGGAAALFGIGQRVNRSLLLPSRNFLVEFASQSNRVYYVQYSSNLVTWKTSRPAVQGNGNWIQWIDNGQPKTDNSPASESARFYRLIMLP
jgi:hypothetical protein